MPKVAMEEEYRTGPGTTGDAAARGWFWVLAMIVAASSFSGWSPAVQTDTPLRGRASRPSIASRRFVAIDVAVDLVGSPTGAGRPGA
jgi:hypothetical protein